MGHSITGCGEVQEDEEGEQTRISCTEFNSQTISKYLFIPPLSVGEQQNGELQSHHY